MSWPCTAVAGCLRNLCQRQELPLTATAVAQAQAAAVAAKCGSADLGKPSRQSGAVGSPDRRGALLPDRLRWILTQPSLRRRWEHHLRHLWHCSGVAHVCACHAFRMQQGPCNIL